MSESKIHSSVTMKAKITAIFLLMNDNQDQKVFSVVKDHQVIINKKIFINRAILVNFDLFFK